MSDTPQLLLAHHLKALKLPTFLREYDKLAQQCAAEGIDHPRYLLRLAELELIDRYSSRCSAFRRQLTSFSTTGVIARNRLTISLASSSRPI